MCRRWIQKNRLTQKQKFLSSYRKKIDKNHRFTRNSFGCLECSRFRAKLRKRVERRVKLDVSRAEDPEWGSILRLYCFWSV